MDVESLLNEAIEYLDYIGWGDKWEREVFEDTRNKLLQWRAEHEVVD